MKNVILIDDHPLFRAGIKQALIDTNNYTILFEASSIASFCTFIKTNNTSLANVIFIIDISLPDGSGFDLLEIIASAGGSKSNCTILSMHNDYEYAEHAFSKGALGYIVKSDELHHILDCLKCLETGKRYISPGAQENTQQLSSVQEQTKSVENLDVSISSTPNFAILSKRELAIIKLVAQEKTSKQISETLFLSQRTVENHRSNICRKLGVSGAHGLIALAVKNKQLINSYE